MPVILEKRLKYLELQMIFGFVIGLVIACNVSDQEVGEGIARAGRKPSGVWVGSVKGATVAIESQVALLPGFKIFTFLVGSEVKTDLHVIGMKLLGECITIGIGWILVIERCWSRVLIQVTKARAATDIERRYLATKIIRKYSGHGECSR